MKDPTAFSDGSQAVPHRRRGPWTGSQAPYRRRGPMPPRLLFSELSGSVYVVTRYTVKPHPTKPDHEMIVAQRKYDVSGDFDAAMVLRIKHIKRQARKKGKKS